MDITRVLDKPLTGRPPTQNWRSGDVFGRGPKRCRSQLGGEWAKTRRLAFDHTDGPEPNHPPSDVSGLAGLDDRVDVLIGLVRLLGDQLG